MPDPDHLQVGANLSPSNILCIYLLGQVKIDTYCGTVKPDVLDVGRRD